MQTDLKTTSYFALTMYVCCLCVICCFVVCVRIYLLFRRAYKEIKCSLFIQFHMSVKCILKSNCYIETRQ